MALQIYNRLTGYLFPMVLLAAALYGAFLVLLEILTFQLRPQEILDSSSMRERIFGKTWLTVDKMIANGESETDLPKIVAKAYGTVLELGPGSGNQLPRYDLSKIDRIYGVEPNVHLHDALRSNVKKYGLSDLYTIVPCGVENLERLKEFGIEPGSIDTVTSVQVLCSVPKPEALVKDLFRLLKPGGQMVVYEHVKSEDYLSYLVQLVYNLVWPYGLGNCHLDRPTGKYLLEAGNWSTTDELEWPKDEDGWMILPRVSGRLVK